MENRKKIILAYKIFEVDLLAKFEKKNRVNCVVKSVSNHMNFITKRLHKVSPIDSV